ncbi:MAG TPA: hypothetical protein DC049_15550, partial [Spirochaetia bacterium]|nr:hypothetical protein [Spirochaetia bacterium]
MIFLAKNLCQGIKLSGVILIGFFLSFTMLDAQMKTEPVYNGFENDFIFTSAFDQSEQKAVIYLP